MVSADMKLDTGIFSRNFEERTERMSMSFKIASVHTSLNLSSSQSVRSFPVGRVQKSALARTTGWRGPFGCSIVTTVSPLFDLTALSSSSVGEALESSLSRFSFFWGFIFNRFPRYFHFLEELSSITFGAGGDGVSPFDAMRSVIKCAKITLTQAL